MVRKKIAFTAATFAVCFLLALLLWYEPYASDAIRETLALFVRRVLPPLFPYMVVSRLMVSMELLTPLSRVLGLSRLFRLPDASSAVVFTGLLCGFPVGAAGTCTLYENGQISKKEAGRLAALSSNASPAFLLGTVAALWNSKAYGLFLYAVQLFSAVGIACAAARLSPPENTVKKEAPVRPAMSFPSELCRAVSDSASACLAVCAYLVFFRVMAVLFSHLLPCMTRVFSTLFEFSSGCVDGASVGGHTGIFMTGFAVGFAGLSVMMQNYNFLGQRALPMKSLWITKGIQGMVCGTASVLFFRVHPLNAVCAAEVFGEAFSWNRAVLPLAALTLLTGVSGRWRHGKRG